MESAELMGKIGISISFLFCLAFGEILKSCLGYDRDQIKKSEIKLHIALYKYIL